MASRRGGSSDWERQARISRQAVERQRREAERAKVAADRESKNRHAEARKADVDRQNQELEHVVHKLGHVLQQGLHRSARIAVTPQLIEPRMPILALGKDAHPIAKPSWDEFEPPRPGVLSSLLRGNAAHERQVESAKARFRQAERAAEARELARQQAVQAAQLAHADHVRKIAEDAKRRNAVNVDLGQRFAAREPRAVADYVGRVLDRVPLPAGFPHRSEVAFSRRAEQVVIEFELPSRDVVPDETSFQYLSTKDEVRSKQRPKAESDAIYRSLISQVALLCIRDVLDADPSVQSVAFNGFVDAINPATGVQQRVYLISLEVDRADFPPDDNLAKVTPEVCVRHLRAVVSNHPYELTPIKPILDFDLTKYNFIAGLDAVSTLDSRPDLMEMSPTMFEHLVRQLFEAKGAEGWTTGQSNDDGVDAVIAQRNSLIGGLSIVQAKRYSRVIGVSHIRELAGAMEEKKAGFGILITTSWFTAGCRAKALAHGRMQLINGEELIYEIKEHLGKDVLIGIPNRPKSQEDVSTSESNPA